MKYLVIIAAALVCTQAAKLPYIVQTNSLESSEEEYRIVLPAQNQQPISLPGIGVINQPVAQAVKVKVPRFVSQEVKQQIITQTLAAHGVNVQGLGANTVKSAAAREVVRQLRQAPFVGSVVNDNVVPGKVPQVPTVSGGVPVAPVVPGVLTVGVVSKGPGAPVASGVPVASGTPIASGVPVVPGVSVGPAASAAPAIPVVPAVQGVPAGAVVPNAPVIPAVGKVPVVAAVVTVTKAPIAVSTPVVTKSN